MQNKIRKTMWKETELSIVAQHITPKFSGLKYHQFIISHDSEDWLVSPSDFSSRMVVSPYPDFQCSQFQLISVNSNNNNVMCAWEQCIFSLSAVI